MLHNYLAHAVAVGIVGAIGWGAIEPAVPQINVASVSVEASQLSQKSTDTIVVLRSSPALTGDCAPGSKTVIADALRIRSAPSYGPVVGKLDREARVAVTTCQAGWAQIGGGLWVAEDYLRVPGENPENDENPDSDTAHLSD